MEETYFLVSNFACAFTQSDIMVVPNSDSIFPGVLYCSGKFDLTKHVGGQDLLFIDTDLQIC